MPIHPSISATHHLSISMNTVTSYITHSAAIAVCIHHFDCRLFVLTKLSKPFFASLAKRLRFFRRINASKSNLMLLISIV